MIGQVIIDTNAIRTVLKQLVGNLPAQVQALDERVCILEAERKPNIDNLSKPLVQFMFEETGEFREPNKGESYISNFDPLMIHYATYNYIPGDKQKIVRRVK